MNSIPMKSPCSTSLVLARQLHLDTRKPTNEQVENRPENNKEETSCKTTKTSTKILTEQTPVVDEIYTKELSLFNVCLVSAGQVQRLDIQRATNERMQNNRKTRNKLPNHKNKWTKQF